MSRQREFRASVLASYGANPREVDELLAYNHNVFDPSALLQSRQLPLASEAHVAAWEEYAISASKIGTFEALKSVLVQLWFPIQAGISQTQVYRSATRKGIPVDSMSEATGLGLQQPEQLQLKIHPTLAGAIPVLLTGNRQDFVTLVQALTMRNEPKPVPASMGACIVAGFNNWDRIHQYRQHWEAQNPFDCSEASWMEEFQWLISQKELYQDRFIILSHGPYSNVSAADLGLPDSEWQSLSLVIRLEHECTHYLTRRWFNSMRNNLLDELIADYMGIVAAVGHYRADWFLYFLGLEAFPAYREGGRLQSYQGQPPLSDGAFKVLQALVRSAAENLEHFDAKHIRQVGTLHLQVLVTLACLTLEELASCEASDRLQMTLNQLQATLFTSSDLFEADIKTLTH